LNSAGWLQFIVERNRRAVGGIGVGHFVELPNMKIRGPLLLLCVALLAASRPSAVLAQLTQSPGNPEFGLGIGYANLSIGSNSEINSQGAIRFDPSLSFAPLTALPQLRFGADVGASLVLDNSTRTLIINNGGLVYHGSSDVPLWTLEPEVRVSWRQTFGDRQDFFLEPGVAGGQMFAFLNLQPANPGEANLSENDSTPYGRVFLRAGIPVTQGFVAIEGSWLSGGHLNFGQNMDGHVTEFYIGLVGAIRF
jgi:hypothetical protein